MENGELRIEFNASIFNFQLNEDFLYLIAL